MCVCYRYADTAPQHHRGTALLPGHIAHPFPRCLSPQLLTCAPRVGAVEWDTGRGGGGGIHAHSLPRGGAEWGFAVVRAWVPPHRGGGRGLRPARYRLPRGTAGAAPGGTNHRGSAVPRGVGASPTRVRRGRNLGLGTRPGGHLAMLRASFLLITVVPAEVRFDGAQSRPSTCRGVGLWVASVSRSAAAACSLPLPRWGRRGPARPGLWVGRVTITWQAVVCVCA